MVKVPYTRDRDVRQNLLHEFTEATLHENSKRNICALADDAEEHRDNLLYLFKFVYQTAFGIKTLEEALTRLDIAKNTPLQNLLTNYPRGARANNIKNKDNNKNKRTYPHGIYLNGLSDDIVITDVKTVLKIVYNNYDFWDNYMDIYNLLRETRMGKTKAEVMAEIDALIASHEAVSTR